MKQTVETSDLEIRALRALDEEVREDLRRQEKREAQLREDRTSDLRERLLQVLQLEIPSDAALGDSWPYLDPDSGLVFDLLDGGSGWQKRLCLVRPCDECSILRPSIPFEDLAGFGRLLREWEWFGSCLGDEHPVPARESDFRPNVATGYANDLVGLSTDEILREIAVSLRAIADNTWG